MIRRTLFTGLMISLGGVLVYMVIQGRRAEKRVKPAPVEIVRESRPTALRVLFPHELTVVSCRIEWAQAEGEQKPVANRKLEIRNSGTVNYQNAMLKISYFDRAGKSLEPTQHLVSNPLPAGKTVTLSEIGVEASPSSVRCGAQVLYAEPGPAGQ